MTRSTGQIAGDQLRAWRQARGLKQKEVAAILGYSTSYISRCERGYRHLGANAWRVLQARRAAGEVAA